MSQRHRLVLQFRLTWLPQLPQESHLRHSGFPHHHHHHHLLHHHHHHRHDCHQHQYNLQVILHVVQHSPIRDVVGFSKQKLFPIDLQLQAIVISILVVIFLTNLHPHQAIGVHIIISDEVFRAISVGFKTVGVFKIIRSNQFISCSPVRGKIFAQIFVWNKESGSFFKILINNRSTTGRGLIKIVVRNTSRRRLQLKIISSIIVSHKTL